MGLVTIIIELPTKTFFALMSKLLFQIVNGIQTHKKLPIAYTFFEFNLKYLDFNFLDYRE